MKRNTEKTRAEQINGEKTYAAEKRATYARGMRKRLLLGMALLLCLVAAGCTNSVPRETTTAETTAVETTAVETTATEATSGETTAVVTQAAEPFVTREIQTETVPKAEAEKGTELEKGTEIEKGTGTGSVGVHIPGDWGITLQAREVTATGLKLDCIQQGGELQGNLSAGTEFRLERKQNGVWEAVPDVVEGKWGWEDMLLIIEAGKTTSWDIQWQLLYGPLPSGEYRITKDIYQCLGTGYCDTRSFSAEFSIQ